MSDIVICKDDAKSAQMARNIFDMLLGVVNASNISTARIGGLVGVDDGHCGFQV